MLAFVTRRIHRLFLALAVVADSDDPATLLETPASVAAVPVGAGVAFAFLLGSTPPPLPPPPLSPPSSDDLRLFTFLRLVRELKVVDHIHMLLYSSFYFVNSPGPVDCSDCHVFRLI
jgi:hypothetical protein